MCDLMKLKQTVRKSLEACPVGTEEDKLQNGRDFYRLYVLLDEFVKEWTV